MFKHACIASLGLFAAHALAQTYEVLDKDSDKLVLTAGAVASNNINPTLDNKEQASGYRVSANGKLVMANDALWLRLAYDGQYQQWLSQTTPTLEQDSEQAFDTSLLARLYMTDAWVAEGEVAYEAQEQQPGSGLSRLRKHVVQADERRQTAMRLGLSYGQDPLNRRLGLEVERLMRRYDDSNAYASEFELDQTTITAHVAFTLSAATYLLVQLEYQEDDYLSPLRFDSDKLRAMAGLHWQFSGKTSLRALLGGYQRSMPQGSDMNGTAWQVSLDYQPVDYWQVSLLAMQDSVAGERETASNTEVRHWQLRSQYQVNDHWLLGATAGWMENRFEYPTNEEQLKEASGDLWLAWLHKAHSQIRLSLHYRTLDFAAEDIDYNQLGMGLAWQYRF